LERWAWELSQEDFAMKVTRQIAIGGLSAAVLLVGAAVVQAGGWDNFRLITEVFGFSSGFYARMRRGLIDYKLGQLLLLITLPLALVGTRAAESISSDVLKGILGVGLFAIATSFLRSPEPTDFKRLDADIQAHLGNPPQTFITSTAGETFCYTWLTAHLLG
jgi:uncharacterized membrane protein YfcA